MSRGSKRTGIDFRAIFALFTTKDAPKGENSSRFGKRQTTKTAYLQAITPKSRYLAGMANLLFKGTPVHTNGELPKVGEVAPDFTLVDASLAERTLADYAGKKKVLTINPSYDTGVCQATARAFNQKASAHEHAAVLLISADLPFAQKRFCGAEGLDKVTALSSFRSSFAEDYGLKLEDGPLAGLTARAVIVLDEDNRVLHTELVDDIVNEPNYDAALAALS